MIGLMVDILCQAALVFLFLYPATFALFQQMHICSVPYGFEYSDCAVPGFSHPVQSLFLYEALLFPLFILIIVGCLLYSLSYEIQQALASRRYVRVGLVIPVISVGLIGIVLCFVSYNQIHMSHATPNEFIGLHQTLEEQFEQNWLAASTTDSGQEYVLNQPARRLRGALHVTIPAGWKRDLSAPFLQVASPDFYYQQATNSSQDVIVRGISIAVNSNTHDAPISYPCTQASCEMTNAKIAGYDATITRDTNQDGAPYSVEVLIIVGDQYVLLSAWYADPHSKSIVDGIIKSIRIDQ